jgi:4-amino-4-deoxy-L-arabinose transferase-like glycosyltransferase
MSNQIRKTSGQDQYHSDPMHVRILNLLDPQPFRVVGVILVLGILLSVITISGHPASMKSGETDSWWVIVLNLLHGHGYSLCLMQYFPFCGPSNQATAMREPAPVLLFTLAAWLGKESLFSAELVEALIYLAIIVAVYFLTREWAGARSAVIASFLWTIYRPALELIPQVSGDLFAALCVSLGILFTLRARKRQKALDWIMAGICLGVAVISRSATLVIAGVVIGEQIFDGLHQRWQAKISLKTALLFASVIILIMAPWWIRNKVSLGRTIIGSSLTGYNLYRHNYMIEKDQYFRYVGPEEGAQAIKALVSRQSDLDSDENEADFDLVYRGEALKIIKAQPAKYIMLSAYRFFPLWFDWKIAEAYGRPTDHYGYTIMILQALLLILAFIGLHKNVRQTWPLWGSILAISLAYMAVDARLLYVMPVMPLVISLGGTGGSNLLKKALKES